MYSHHFFSVFESFYVLVLLFVSICVLFFLLSAFPVHKKAKPSEPNTPHRNIKKVYLDVIEPPKRAPQEKKPQEKNLIKPSSFSLNES